MQRLFGWLLFQVLRGVLNYRSRVIADNLRQCFPALDATTLAQLKTRYYRHLAKQIVEMNRLQLANKAEVMRAVHFENPQLLSAAIESQKKVVVIMGHSGNWELAGAAAAIQFNALFVPVYRHLRNPHFDRFFYRLRSRFGQKPVADTALTTAIPALEVPHVIVLLADQWPAKKKGVELTFLGRKTLFYRGADVLCQRYGYTPVFAHVALADGRYSVRFKLMNKNNATVQFASLLEKEIRKQPVNWMWSHRRWKNLPSAP